MSTIRGLFGRWKILGKQILLGLLGLIIVLVIWQCASSFEWINPILISSPSQIIEAMTEQVRSGNLWNHLYVTVIEFIISFGIASVIGMLLGLLMGWYRRVEYVLDPYIWILDSAPLLGLFPLFIIFFGLGFNTVVFISMLFAIIPITVNTFTGVKSINPILIRVSRSFGASDFQILYKVALPNALPMIVGGLRIGVERALMGVVVGEMFVSNQGLGYLISYYGARLQTSNLFVGLVLVVIFGLMLTQTIRLLENRLLKWKS